MRESMLGKILMLVMTIPDVWLGMLVDLLEKLNSSGSGEVARELKKFLRGEMCWVKETVKPAEKPSSYLHLISGGKKLTIPACTGKRTIAKAETTFRGFIDSHFFGLDVEGVATLDTDVEVHELVRDGKFEDIYSAVGADLNKLVLTQDQVISFVKKHSDWLRTDGYGTFFLMKKGKEFFVAGVYVGADGLGVNADRLSCGYVWGGECCRHFVLPQLTPKS